jgi:hypothetical protein
LPSVAPRQEDLVAHLIERFAPTEAQRRPEDDIDRDSPKRAPAEVSRDGALLPR